MATHIDLGKEGEQLAKAYLEKLDHEILEENWTYGKAEVDLITYINHTIVFVEVKTRSGSAYGEPEAFVDNRKQRLLSDAADQYILLMNHEGEVRFDIISILFNKQHTHTLKHIENAFWPGMDQ